MVLLLLLSVFAGTKTVGDDGSGGRDGGEGRCQGPEPVVGG